MDINYYSPRKKLSVRSLTTMAGVLQSDIYEIILEAERLETMRRFKENVAFLNGQSIVLFTEKPSGTTRLAFELAVTSLGGNAIVVPAAEDEEEFEKSLSITSKTDVLAIFIDKEGVFGYANKLPQSVPLFNLTGIDNPLSVLAVLFVIKKRFGAFKDLKVAVKDRSNLVLALSKCEVDLYYLTENQSAIVENDVKYLSQFNPIKIGEYGENGIKAAVKDPSAVLSVDEIPLDDLDAFASEVPDFALYYPAKKSEKVYDITEDCTLALIDIIRATIALTCKYN